MTAPRGADYDLQCGIVALLKASDDLKSLIGDPPRINPEQNENIQFPYIMIGEGQTLSAAVEYFRPVDVFSTINVWSRNGGFPEAKRISAAIIAALQERQDTLALAEYRCTSLLFESSHNQRDPNGKDKQIIMTFKAHLAPK